MTLFHINIKKDKRSVWFQITVDLVTFNKVCLMSSVWMGEKQGIWLRTMVKGMVICFFSKGVAFFFCYRSFKIESFICKYDPWRKKKQVVSYVKHARALEFLIFNNLFKDIYFFYIV